MVRPRARRFLGAGIRRNLRNPGAGVSSGTPDYLGADFVLDPRQSSTLTLVGGPGGTVSQATNATGGSGLYSSPLGFRPTHLVSGVNGQPSLRFETASTQRMSSDSALISALTDGSELRSFACFLVRNAALSSNTGTLLSFADSTVHNEFCYLNDGSPSNAFLRSQVRDSVEGITNSTIVDPQDTSAPNAFWARFDFGTDFTLARGDTTSPLVVPSTTTPGAPTANGVNIGVANSTGSFIDYATMDLAFFALWYSALPSIATLHAMSEYANGVWGSQKQP